MDMGLFFNPYYEWTLICDKLKSKRDCLKKIEVWKN